MARPSTGQMLCLINKTLANNFHRLPLSISQGTVLQHCDARLATNLQGNMHQITSQYTLLPSNDGTNCCPFLSFGICDRLLHDTDFRQQSEWERVREIAEDVISNLPSNVNEHRDVGEFYDVAAAHSILTTNNLPFEEYKLSDECASANKVFSSYIIHLSCR